METNEQIKILREKIIIGLKESYRKLIKMKRLNNSVLVVSEKGKVIKIKP